jgi:amino acid adenylation domain-containing protein
MTNLDEEGQREQLLSKILAEKGIQRQAARVINTRDDKPFYEQSFSQQRMWFLDRLHPGNTTYNLTYAIRVMGSLNVSLLEAALNELVSRNEILRTRFDEIDGVPIQNISDDATVPIQVENVFSLSPDDRAVKLKESIERETEYAFDLKNGQLIKTTVIEETSNVSTILFSLHHIVSDAWSMTTLVEQLANFYELLEQGEPLPGNDASLQYADYSEWQLDMLRRGEFDPQIDYWRTQLDGNEYLNLPTDSVSVNDQANNGGSVSLELPKNRADDITELSKSLGVTPFMLCLAAYAVLLSRYSGQNDILIGTPVWGRDRPELENVLGCFVNTVALRVKFNDELTFSSLVEHTKETVLSAFSNQDVPFERVVEELGVERNAATTPLINTTFSLINSDNNQLAIGGMAVEEIDVPHKTAKFDLGMTVIESNSSYLIELDYNKNRHALGSVEAMLRHYSSILESCVRDPSAPISETQILTAEEVGVIRAWSQPEFKANAEFDFRNDIERHGKETLEQTALVSGDDSITYEELNKRANQVASYLIQHDVSKGSLVAIGLTRSIDSVVCCLAVLKAGAAFLSLDMSHPVERISQILADANVQLVLSNDLDEGKVPEHIERFNLDQKANEIASLSEAAELVEVSNSDLAYVIYTSGSTGQPKGVEVSHGALNNLVQWSVREFELSNTDRSTQLASAAFDASVWELWPFLSAGATVSIVPDSLKSEPKKLIDFIVKEEISVCFMPTPLAELCLNFEWNQRGALRILLTGGDVLYLDSVSNIPFKLYNNYGPTENAVVATSDVVDMREGNARPTIGRPIDGVEVHVLDTNMNRVPVGVAGELVLSGASLASGYRNAEHNQASFCELMIDGVSRKAYRTGDRVKWLESGKIDYLGRLDRQVQIRGFRIELNEIESVANQHPSIRRSFVIVASNERNENYLVEYIEVNQASLDQAELKQWHLERLPAYMLPQFIFVDHLPINASGKVDESLLPKPELVRGLVIAPQSDSEKKIAEIWQDVLKISDVGVNENFFDLGGHSLLAIKVVSRVAVHLGTEIPLHAVFDEPTIQKFAQGIDESRWTRARFQPPPLEPFERDSTIDKQYFPQSPSQRRLWFLEQFNPSENVYGINDLYQIEGDLDVSALKKSFNDIINRHEILGTTFTIDEQGVFAQVVSNEVPDIFTFTNLEILDSELREEQARGLILSESERAFDLLNGPIVRVMLLRFSEKFHLLLISKHHVVTDAWSESIFIGELSSFYYGRINNAPSTPAPLPIQFADYASWLDDWLQFGVLEEMLFYWREHLRDAPPTIDLKTDHPRLKHQRSSGGAVEFSLNADLTAQLKTVARERNITLFMALLTLFKVLLARYSDQSDIVVGVPVANRAERDLEDLIGFFVNTLAIRTKIENDPSFNQLAALVCSNLLNGFEQQDLPFERLVEELAPGERWRKAPVFQVLFVLQNEPVQTLELENTKVSRMHLLPNKAKFDITLSMSEFGDEIFGALEFNADLFEYETIQRMQTHFQELIKNIVSNPNVPLSQVSMLSAEERLELMSNSQGPLMPTKEGNVCSWFEEHAANNPDAIAVSDESGELTYGELNNNANKLAHYLVSIGAEPGNVIAVGMPRSLDMLVTFVAIFKVGAAYLPLDVSNPPERLKSVLDSAEAAFTLIDGSSKKVFDQVGGAYLCLSDKDDEVSQQSEAPLVRDLDPESLAYVVFTSGSTGTPKGVEVPHRALSNLVSWQQRTLKVTPQDRLSQLAGAAFDATMLEWWVSISSGASVHVVDDASRLFPSELVAWLTAQRISIAFIPTLLAEKVLREEVPEDSVLRFIFTGGEALKQRPSKNAPYLVLNAYGPAEGGVVSTYSVTSSERVDLGLPSIGMPIDGVQTYVLDDSMEPLPIGMVGELYIGGKSLANGYRNSPELTNQRFFANPFSDNPNEKLYRTGDQVRYRYDGKLEFVGRADDQIKIRGFRIELNEISTTMREHEGVDDVFVTGDADNFGHTSIAAFITKCSESSLSSNDDELIEQLKELASKKLPEYMVPSSITVLKDMPITSNGKVDKKKLPKPVANNFIPNNDEIILARDEIEQGVALIWTELLSYEPVSIHHDFFTVGGHSLLAINLKSEVFKAFGVNIDLATLFEKGTVENLGLHIKDLVQLGVENASEVSQEWGGAIESSDSSEGLIGRVKNVFVKKGPEVAKTFAKKLDGETIVPIMSGGSETPVFFIHPIGGDVYCYAQIAQGISDAHPIFGIQAEDLEMKDATLDIKLMAQRYVSYIRSVQPSGPYYLSGWSLGGIIAFEVACQLTESGDKVDVLALLDSYPSMNRTTVSQSSDKLVLNALVQDTLNVNGKSAQVDWLTDDSSEVSAVANDIEGLNDVTMTLIEDAFDVLRVAEAVANEMTTEQFVAKWDFYRALYRAWEQYHPAVYSGHVSLILASDSLSQSGNTPSTLWRESARGGFNIEVVQGNHYSMMRGETGQLISDILNNIIKESGVT